MASVSTNFFWNIYVELCRPARGLLGKVLIHSSVYTFFHLLRGGCWGVFGNTFLYYSILTTYSSKVVRVGKLTLMYARMWENHNVFITQASKSYSLLRFFIILWRHFTSTTLSAVAMCDCNTGFSGWNLMDIVDAYTQLVYAVYIFVFLCYSWMIVPWAIRNLASVFFLGL